MSTLFVDTINEKTSGNGIIIPGHVIQIVREYENDTRLLGYNQHFVYCVRISASITPKATALF